MAEEQTQTDAVELATELTIAWLSNPNTRAQAGEVPDFLRTMHEAVAGLSSGAPTKNAATEASSPEPAVTVRKSLASPDHIISLIDGKPYKTLKRHLATHGLTPAEYRQRYGLKSDYPMVAPAFAERRRAIATAIGLGRKGRNSGSKAEVPAEVSQAQAGRSADPTPESGEKGSTKTSTKASPKTRAKSPTKSAPKRPRKAAAAAE